MELGVFLWPAPAPGGGESMWLLASPAPAAAAAVAEIPAAAASASVDSGEARRSGSGVAAGVWSPWSLQLSPPASEACAGELSGGAEAAEAGDDSGAGDDAPAALGVMIGGGGEAMTRCEREDRVSSVEAQCIGAVGCH